ncbi:uncharacterized protein UV8b_04223 [Ustilaginoidea virens]|uniref:N-acetyltransferase domain-containing protein n=1 Tax=Ustilaginoidea virens TaxID=1159556 RepID=A0A8E5MHI4_USTVR|nr:uncharacterized protein UV8b_04223 [Ustilaginoidea virens]QUC19982.1 hypothetical protein UV8b_04223 [Ustilaginoidea virens]
MPQDEADVDGCADLRIELMSHEQDFIEAFHVASEAFGRQTHDDIWMAMNPGWDTAEGKSRGAALMAQRWRRSTRDRVNRPNAMFVKATLPLGGHGRTQGRRTVGTAIWLQASAVDGYGDAPATDWRRALNVDEVCPGDAAAQRYLVQVMQSLQRQRVGVVRQKASASPPSVMVLDLCAVDPAFQGRGVAKRMVQWGLEEAKARGGLECILEASVMGRRVYEKLGFRQQGPEIEYEVDEQFAGRRRPSNVFMRTGPLEAAQRNAVLSQQSGASSVFDCLGAGEPSPGHIGANRQESN